MKVVLIKDVKDLGKAGEVVNASEGYVRNFLIPRKLAIIADSGAMNTVEQKRKMLEAKDEKLLAAAKSTAEKLKDVKLTIVARVGSGSKLYGSITNHEIADALQKNFKITVDKRKIILSEPIKTLGKYEVPVKLHHDVNTAISVEITAQS